MLVSNTKIRADWEKLEDVNIEDPILENKLPKKQFTKENNFILRPPEQFQIQSIFVFETLFTSYFKYQKQLFDNLGIDQNVIFEFDKFCHTMIKESGISLNAYVKFSKIQSAILADIVKMNDNLLNQGLDWCSKIVSNLITKK